MAATSERERVRFTDATVAGGYQATHLQRVVNVYPLAENELDHIGNVNGLTTLFFSVGLALASVAASFWIAGETAGDSVSERAKAIFDVVPILAAIVAFIAIGASGILWQSGHSTLNRLKKECERPATIVTTSTVSAADNDVALLRHKLHRLQEKLGKRVS